MHGVIVLGFRRLAFAGLVGGAILGGLSRADAASISISWTAPTTNADGTPLQDLAGYRLYVDTSAPGCPSGDFLAVPSSTAAPAAGQQVSDRLTGLDANTTYFARVTAVDMSGNESSCSAAASGVARSDLGVTPTTTVAFGSVATGATVDRTFTVQNTSAASLSGSASVGAPFRIASGGSFSLAAGATQNVVVRFQPTAAGSFAGNVNFTAAGDTLSRGVSGTATGGATPLPETFPPPTSTGPLKVFITQPKPGATVSGTAAVVLWAEGTSGSANVFTLSANGAVVGSQTTAARGPVTIPWKPGANGSNTLTASVRDAAGYTGTTTMQVNVTGASGGVVTPPPPTSTGPLMVSITQPKPGATVSGTASVVLWVEGTSGSANVFTLSANGAVVGGQTTPARGPVTIPWTPRANGSNTLTASVRDAAGHTGTITMQVNVTGASGGGVIAPTPPPPVNDTLAVFVTQPTEGAIVSGTAWIAIWADGTTGSSNTFTLSVDGGLVGTQTTGATGPVLIPWKTSVANGFHTLTATVRDAAGRTGRASFRLYVFN